MAILTSLFFIIIIPYTASLTFNFTNINPNSKNMFTLGGGAHISDDGIQVTPEKSSSMFTGRATYIKPFHLWDNVSNELASFSTSFSFMIESDPNDRFHPADGLTFFLAQNNSVIPPRGFMGLPFNTNNVSTIPFVAVEFDTYCNHWENTTGCDHVGININSLASVRHQKWLNNISHGRECHAWIEYDSASKNFSASFTGYQNNKVVRQDGLVYTIDLRDELPEWVLFGFSASTGVLFEKNNVKSWVFNSSGLKVDTNNASPPNKTVRVVGLIVGISVLVTFFVTGAFFYMKKKRKDNEVELDQDHGFSEEMSNEIEIGATGPRRFSYLELARSTNGFAENNKLGEGGFGGVYKGLLNDLSTYVAVKRVSKTSMQGIKQYASEVRIISRLRHRNLVQLTGWCHEKGELLLVYEFMENGSLDLHLFKQKSLLTWDTRYKIAHGLASALLYLHEEGKQCVLHRDIKSSNVMLDLNFNAKLGDFGLAKLVDHENGSQTTMLAGTFGYMAPEFAMMGNFSKESDVYSFGVVALEIACGRKPIDHDEARENKIWLLEWVWELYGTKSLLEAVDPRLGSDFEEEEITQLMIVGLWCVHPDSKFRPSMRQVIQVLNFEANLPRLPLKMPEASYSIPLKPSAFDLASFFQNQLLTTVSNVDFSKQSISSIASSYFHGR
uniref:L-type lectin-domain containing receptor kinase IX.1-like n=1 Tax=Erigeron canadensis TaxID=72917 RepID=UPI001CB8F85A|nr:L-type lectin-domain containing receptor kinase IX.1-like [Erigeron canadensis]